jgi:hypothetical protein
MDVDFNGLRSQLSWALTKLTNTLHKNLMPDGFEIQVPTEDIQESMDEIRELVGILNCCLQPGDELCISMHQLNDKLPRFGTSSEWYNKKYLSDENETDNES